MALIALNFQVQWKCEMEVWQGEFEWFLNESESTEKSWNDLCHNLMGEKGKDAIWLDLLKVWVQKVWKWATFALIIVEEKLLNLIFIIIFIWVFYPLISKFVF